MKTMISALLSTIIITLAIAGNANAQKQDNTVSFTSNNIFLNESAVLASKEGIIDATANTKASLKVAKASSKALKDFNRSYKNASGVTWSMEKYATFATFSKDNVKTSVVYNKRGNWCHTLTVYPADKVPQNIVDVIDYAYPKDNLKQATKIEEDNIEFYIVQLEGKTTIKKVTVYNREVNVIEQFTKSK